jgi:hypothetical protein
VFFFGDDDCFMRFFGPSSPKAGFFAMPYKVAQQVWRVWPSPPGGKGRAVKLWNQRESLYKELVAAKGSLSLVQEFGETVNKMARNLAEVVELAQGALAETHRESKRHATTYKNGATSLDSAVLADALSDEVNPSLLARLLAAARLGSLIFFGERLPIKFVKRDFATLVITTNATCVFKTFLYTN